MRFIETDLEAFKGLKHSFKVDFEMINTEDKFQSLIKNLEDKFDDIGQNTGSHLNGLLHSKPINYRIIYIHTDALLSLQLQRTTLPDEMVFIVYHQINELIFKMILWEIEQVSERKM